VHGLGIARDKRVPPGEILALRHQPIAAGRRQPFEPPHVARGEPHAILHLRLAMGIVAAAAFLAIEQLAADAGEDRCVGVFVDQLVQAAAAAAVAQALPLGARHLGHRLAAPERGLRLGHVRESLAEPCSRWRWLRHWLGFVLQPHPEEEMLQPPW